jgi:putative methionine-R-sulfoxide reductase with GAF domain
MRKYYKTAAYLSILIIVILLALLIFNILSDISREVMHSTLFDALNNSIKLLYTYFTLAFSIVIVFILMILFLDYFNKSISLKRIDNKLQESNIAVNVENDDSNKISEEQKLELEKKEKDNYYKERKNDIKEALKEIITKKSSDTKAISEKVLSGISKFYEIVQGEIYLKEKKEKKDLLIMSAAYAFFIPEGKIFEFEIGEGLIGQVAKEKKCLNLTNVPDGYIRVASGLGSSTPSNLIIVPMVNNKDELMGVMELSSFKQFEEVDEKILVEIGNYICQFYQMNEK